MKHLLAAGLLALSPALTLADTVSGNSPHAVETVAAGGFFTLYDFLNGPPTAFHPSSDTDAGQDGADALALEPPEVDDPVPGEGFVSLPAGPQVPPPFVFVKPGDSDRPRDIVLPIDLDPGPFAGANEVPLPSTLLLSLLALGAMRLLPHSKRQRRPR